MSKQPDDKPVYRIPGFSDAKVVTVGAEIHVIGREQTVRMKPPICSNCGEPLKVEFDGPSMKVWPHRMCAVATMKIVRDSE